MLFPRQPPLASKSHNISQLPRLCVVGIRPVRISAVKLLCQAHRHFFAVLAWISVWASRLDFVYIELVLRSKIRNSARAQFSVTDRCVGCMQDGTLIIDQPEGNESRFLEDLGPWGIESTTYEAGGSRS